MEISNQVAVHISAFISKTEYVPADDEQLISNIFAAVTNDFNNIEGANKKDESLLRDVYVSTLFSRVCRVARMYVEGFPDNAQKDDEVYMRVRMLQDYIKSFTPMVNEPIRKYFERHGAFAVTFHARRLSGQRFGTVAVVTEKEGEMSKRYFVTSCHPFHEKVDGDSVEHKVGSEDRMLFLDYKDVFVHRVLEKLELGPKVDFVVAPELGAPSISTDKSAMLIVSQDLRDSNTEVASFDRFKRISRDAQSLSQSCGVISKPSSLDISEGGHDEDSLCGASMMSCNGPDELEFSTCTQIEAAERNKLVEAGVADRRELERRVDARMEEAFSTPTAQRDLKTIDLLCRAMHLTDVLINTGHFGRVINRTTGEEVGWRVVDFRILQRGELQTDRVAYRSPRLAVEFKALEHRHWRYDCNPALRRMLLRCHDAVSADAQRRLLEGSSASYNWREALSVAYTDVAYLLESSKDALEMEEAVHQRKLADLRAYGQGITDSLRF